MECAICMDLLSMPAEDRLENGPNFNLEALSNHSSPASLQKTAFYKSRSFRDLSCTLCGHLFHTKCLQNWFLSNRTCPNCRKDIPANKIIQISRPEEETLDGDSFHPPLVDLDVCLSDNLAELMDQNGTLIMDYNLLKDEYVTDKEQIDFVTGCINELKLEIEKMRSESEALKEVQLVKGKRRGGKRKCSEENLP